MVLPDQFLDHDAPAKQYDSREAERRAHRRDGARCVGPRNAGVRPRMSAADKRLDQLLVERGLAETPRPRPGAGHGGRGVVAATSGSTRPACASPTTRRSRCAARSSLGLARRHQARPRALTISASIRGTRSRSISARRPAASPTCCWRAAPRRCIAVDVGHGQLAGSCARTRASWCWNASTRAISRASEIPEPIDLIVCDASFIGLETGAAGGACARSAAGASWSR